MLNGLDLFSGIGGITLALSEWVKPILYCEIDRYAQSVLLSRMSEGKLPVAPIWDDIKTLGRAELDGIPIDIIYGGFPCQDISFAGNGAGLAGERSGLFYEIARLISELRPSFIFLENVPAITTRGGKEVVGELTSLGYDCRWCVIPAFPFTAISKGERWFLLAKTKGERSQGDVLEKNRVRKTSLQPRGISSHQRGNNSNRWTDEPPSRLVRLANGISHRVERTECDGNAVVYEQAEEAFKCLMGIQELKS